MTSIYLTPNSDLLPDRIAGVARSTTAGRVLAKSRCSSYRPRHRQEVIL